MKSNSRICPICNCNSGELLHKQFFKLPANSKLPSKYNIVSCSKCGFCYADTPASQSTYDDYYNQMSKYEDKTTASGGALDVIDKQRLELAAETISEKCFNKDVSILDIGCANGGLLVCLNDLGYTNLTGIDISLTCVNNVKQLGYDSFFGGLFNLENVNNKKFDVVVLSHVLEHVRDLNTAVNNIKNLLSENGIVYVEVPDASRYMKYFVVPYYYFDCEHINHFDKVALKNLFEDTQTICLSVNEREILVSQNTLYPVVSVVFKKERSSFKKIITPSNIVRDSLINFINLSEQNTDFRVLLELKENKTEVIVWGAGMFTMRLLENSPLKDCKIKCFIDKDNKKQGESINGVMVYSPEKLYTSKEPIIVCSAIHYNAICQEIKEMGVTNKVFIVK